MSTPSRVVLYERDDGSLAADVESYDGSYRMDVELLDLRPSVRVRTFTKSSPVLAGGYEEGDTWTTADDFEDFRGQGA